MRILESFRQELPDNKYLHVCSVASGALMGYAISKSWEGTIIGALAGVRLSENQSHSQSTLRKLCESVIPLSVGIAAVRTLANRNWILSTLAIAFFYSTFKQYPIATTSSAVFSTICLLTGHTEKQSLVNTVDWLVQNRIFHIGGALVSSFFQVAASFKFGNYSVPAIRVEPGNFLELVRNLKPLGILGGICFISSMINNHLTGIKNPHIFIFIDAQICLMGIFHTVTLEMLEKTRRENDEPEDLIRSSGRIIRFMDQFNWLILRIEEKIRGILSRGDSDPILEEGPSSVSRREYHPPIPEDLIEDPVLKRYTCSIFADPLRHPVLDPTDGISLYERSAIIRVLSEKRFSPVTEQPLTPMQLIHLPALERFIESRIANPSAINEELEREAKEELNRHKQKIQNRLNPRAE